jgi:hypothetical protein
MEPTTPWEPGMEHWEDTVINVKVIVRLGAAPAAGRSLEVARPAVARDWAWRAFIAADKHPHVC